MQVTVALAHSADEETQIEQILDGAGIPYSEVLDADERAGGHAVCFLGRAYTVQEDDVLEARRLLSQKGLTYL